MATVWVYSCTGTRSDTQEGFDSTTEHATCSPRASGQWIEISQHSLVDYEVDGTQAGELLSLILLLMAAAYPVRIVVNTMRGRR